MSSNDRDWLFIKEKGGFTLWPMLKRILIFEVNEINE
jgi:hypothetical protein